MSQWARNNPEQFEQGIDWLDAHSDLADLQKPQEHELCPYCGAPMDEGKHRPGCRLHTPED